MAKKRKSGKKSIRKKKESVLDKLSKPKKKESPIPKVHPKVKKRVQRHKYSPRKITETKTYTYFLYFGFLVLLSSVFFLGSNWPFIMVGTSFIIFGLSMIQITRKFFQFGVIYSLSHFVFEKKHFNTEEAFLYAYYRNVFLEAMLIIAGVIIVSLAWIR